MTATTTRATAGALEVPMQRTPQETRAAFRAFVEAGRHRTDTGEFLGYREVAAALGAGLSSVHRWMLKDFPDVARQMTGERRAMNALLRAIWEDDEARAADVGAARSL